MNDSPTNRNGRIVNNQTNFRPFADGIKIHTPIYQCLNNEPLVFILSSQGNIFNKRKAVKAITDDALQYLCEISSTRLQSVCPNRDWSLDFVRFEELQKLWKKRMFSIQDILSAPIARQWENSATNLPLLNILPQCSLCILRFLHRLT